jgi:orotate phosphoribosyltransferase-like protein
MKKKNKKVNIVDKTKKLDEKIVSFRNKGMYFREIGEKLGIARETARGHYYSALKR